MTDDHITTGSCRCGHVSIAVRGAPLMTFACHCTGCQRMTASAFSLSAMYPEAAVTVEGETVLGGMRGELQHHFCPGCLSWLFTTTPLMGPMVNVRSSMLDGGPAQEPAFIECWTSEKLPWAQTGAAHSYEGFPPQEEFGPLMAAYAEGRG
ncbi:GFA family protein [Paracoccus xiamenensis]|uniref:GFA family protein n=1 Tax=Paracoccus xiamenensis TaxID=2714901 RepID=UPI00140A05EE|nr:GFA family protein [Paracoccus xiamenensis]NHF72205.1 GFA family protein [Paracoccus xiamenensis]